MKITDVKLFASKREGNIKATGSITFEGCFVVSNIKVMGGAKGLFVSMPSLKTADGSYKDICFPVTKEFREVINQAVLAKFEQLDERSDIEDESDLPF